MGGEAPHAERSAATFLRPRSAARGEAGAKRPAQEGGRALRGVPPSREAALERRRRVKAKSKPGARGVQPREEADRPSGRAEGARLPTLVLTRSPEGAKAGLGRLHRAPKKHDRMQTISHTSRKRHSC
jgi:hypothetical protein